MTDHTGRTDHTDRTDRTAGAIYGHLVGDAIGVPYEFRTDVDTVELRGGGSHGQKPGTWSDDGALMLALLDSLLSVGFDPEDQARRALAWADDGAYPPDGDGRFDIGGATAAALDRIRGGVEATDAGGTGERDQGNGSLMRILPIALVDAPDTAGALVRRAQLASRVTHGTVECQVACALYVLIARALLISDETDDRTDPEATLADCAERLRQVYLGEDAYLTALDGLLEHRSKVKTPGGGWVLDSFWSAWESFSKAESYRDAIERAVRLGNDTDTTAAIAGGLAGLRWGVEGIPDEWLGALRGRGLVEELLERLG